MKPKPVYTGNRFDRDDVMRAGLTCGCNSLMEIAIEIPVSHWLLYKYVNNSAPLSEENRNRIEHWVEANR